MPSDTDRSHLTPASATDDAGRQGAPVWPVTALVVLVGWCLLAWTVLVGAVNTATFFGETASRDRYLESGMVCLTALLPVLLLVLLGLLAGSRWGLALLVVPALLLVPLGLSALGEPGDPAKSGYGRGVRWDDAVQDLTRLNWLATGALLLVVGAVVWWRRRRQTGIRANP
jgi:hypothetical protein